MTNALAQINNSLTMWEDADKLNEIRKLFAPKLTEQEFHYFVGLGKATGLNPFLREIWSVKYDERSPASTFIGRDGYRKAAQSQSDYDYHQADAVYENDTFEIENGLLKHSYKLTNRGALIGAYCIAKKQDSSRPMYVFVELKEYSTGKSIWATKPATMIKKVAESQCLRACWQNLLGGTYSEEEMSNSQSDSNMRVVNGQTQTETLKNILAKKFDVIAENPTIDDVVVDVSDTVIVEEEPHLKNGYATIDQMNDIERLLEAKKFDEERKNKAFNYFGISQLSDLTYSQARTFLLQLESIKENS